MYVFRVQLFIALAVLVGGLDDQSRISTQPAPQGFSSTDISTPVEGERPGCTGEPPGLGGQTEMALLEGFDPLLGKASRDGLTQATDTEMSSDLAWWSLASENGSSEVVLDMTTVGASSDGTSLKKEGLIGTETKDFILEIINCYLLPVVCPFGVVGNVLSLVVLLCVHEGNNSTTVLLVALTFSDLGYLLTTLMRKLSCVAGKIDPDRGWWLDVIFLPQAYMLSRFFNHVTSFTTTAIALERFLAVAWPFKVGLLVTRNRTIVTVISINIVCFALQAPFFFIYEVVWKASGDGRKYPSVKTTDFYRRHEQAIVAYNNLMLSNILVFVPMTIVSVCTTIVLRKVGASMRFRQQASAVSVSANSKDVVATRVGNNTGETGTPGDSTPSATAASSVDTTTTITTTAVTTATKLAVTATTAKSTNKPQKKQLKGEQRKITSVLTTIAVIYIVCNLPTALSKVVNSVQPEFSSLQGRYTNIFLVISGINILLLCLNSSVNFLIYIATSSTVGISFRRMLPRCFRLRSDRAHA